MELITLAALRTSPRPALFVFVLQVRTRTVLQCAHGHGRSLTVCLTGLQLVPLNLPNLFLLLLRLPTSARHGPVCQSTGADWPTGRLLTYRAFAGILGRVGLSVVLATVEALGD